MRWLLLLFLLGCAAEAPNQWQGDSSFGPDYLDASSDTETSDPGAVTVIGALAWQTATAPSKYSWLEAKAYCGDLTLGGFSDWRLPSIEELEGTIDDASEKCPDIVAPLKATTFCDDYWSSTQLQGDTSSAWAVLFSYGYADQMPVNKTGRVRCVR